MSAASDDQEIRDANDSGGGSKNRKNASNDSGEAAGSHSTEGSSQASERSSDEDDEAAEGPLEWSEGSESDDEGSSDGASDLEGLPLASDVVEKAATRKKRSKPGTSQSITEEGASSKIGLTFSRILDSRAEKAVMSVRSDDSTR
jgi:hypothetical protein